MTHYALIFHSTRGLTAEELAKRKIEIAAWVKTVTEMGVYLDPRAFGEKVAYYTSEGGKGVLHEGSSDPSLINVVYFDAPSREEAIHIAEIHPGLHYGVSVDLREWTTPRETGVR
jgi:hypothetical protein